jgi:hypothetical protein
MYGEAYTESKPKAKVREYVEKAVYHHTPKPEAYEHKPKTETYKHTPKPDPYEYKPRTTTYKHTISDLTHIIADPYKEPAYHTPKSTYPSAKKEKKYSDRGSCKYDDKTEYPDVRLVEYDHNGDKYVHYESYGDDCDCGCEYHSKDYHEDEYHEDDYHKEDYIKDDYHKYEYKRKPKKEYKPKKLTKDTLKHGRPKYEEYSSYDKSYKTDEMYNYYRNLRDQYNQDYDEMKEYKLEEKKATKYQEDHYDDGYGYEQPKDQYYDDSYGYDQQKDQYYDDGYHQDDYQEQGYLPSIDRHSN